MHTSESFDMITFFWLVACLITGLLFAWFLYGNTARMDKKLRYGLFFLRAIAVGLILFLLFAPLIRNVSYQLEKPVVVIGQDNSLSVGNIYPSGFNKQGYEKDLRQLQKQLSEKYEVKTYHFDDSVQSGFDFSHTGKLSNATQFIKKIRADLPGRNIGAVILASDGIFNRGGSPLYELDHLKAPVYTIALGDTIPKRDLSIANISYNNLVYLDNEFTIEVQVNAFESTGVETRIDVFENDKKQSSQRLEVQSDPFVKNIPIKLKASKLGVQKYTVQVQPVKDEITEKNNAQQIYVEVIDARQKVLIAAAAPHPDITALRQAASINKHHDVKVAIGDGLKDVQVKDYDLIILYQLPGLAGDNRTFMAQLAQNGSLPVWYIIGGQSNIAALSQIQTSLSFNGNTGTLQETYSYLDPTFTAFGIDTESAKMIEGFDPLQAPVARPTVNGNASVVLKQRVGKNNTPFPQLFFTQENGRKAGYLIGEGLWRWKLSEAQKDQGNLVFNSLISNVVQYLSVKDDKRKFKVHPSKTTFDENEKVMINTVLYNDSYVPVNTPEVNMQIRDQKGKVYNFLFSRTETAYDLDAGTLPAGSYTYTAETTLGDKKHSAKGAFHINSLIAEYQQTIANHQLLNAMSVQSNGKMYMPRDLSGIRRDIENNDEVKTLSYEDRKYEELINFKWVFFLILLLISIEWFVRKRNGEI